MKVILLFVGFLICAPTTYADILGINIEFSRDKQGQKWQTLVSIQAGYHLTNYDRVNVSVKTAAEDLRNLRFDKDGKFAVIHSTGMIPTEDLMEILQAMSANQIELSYIQMGQGPPTGMDIWNDINAVCGRWQATNGETYEFEFGGTFEHWLQIPSISKEAQADGANPSQKMGMSNGRFSMEGSFLTFTQKDGTTSTNTFLIKQDEPPNYKGKFFESGYSLTLTSSDGTKRRYDLMYW